MNRMQDGTVAMPLQAVLPQAVEEVAAGGFESHLDPRGNLPFSYGWCAAIVSPHTLPTTPPSVHPLRRCCSLGCSTLVASCGQHVLLDTSLGHVDPPDTTPSRDIRDLLQAAGAASTSSPF